MAPAVIDSMRSRPDRPALLRSAAGAARRGCWIIGGVPLRAAGASAQEDRVTLTLCV